MEKNDIKELIDYIVSTGLDEVYIKTEYITIKTKKTPGPSNINEQDNQQHNLSNVQPQIPIANINGNNKTLDINNNNTERYIELKSPMIGTFYSSPNPEAPPYVKIGDRIKKGQTICIIEAMKLFNEIESEQEGVVVDILVGDSSPVEFDQPLFMIDPNG